MGGYYCLRMPFCSIGWPFHLALAYPNAFIVIQLSEPNCRLYSNYVQRGLITVAKGERIISRNQQFEQWQNVRIFGQDNT